MGGGGLGGGGRREEREAGGNESSTSPDCWLFGFGFGLCLPAEWLWAAGGRGGGRGGILGQSKRPQRERERQQQKGALFSTRLLFFHFTSFPCASRRSFRSFGCLWLAVGVKIVVALDLRETRREASSRISYVHTDKELLFNLYLRQATEADGGGKGKKNV